MITVVSDLPRSGTSLMMQMLTPSVAARSVSEFLNVGLDPALLDPALMVRAVDPTLYRQRSGR